MLESVLWMICRMWIFLLGFSGMCCRWLFSLIVILLCLLNLVMVFFSVVFRFGLLRLRWKVVSSLCSCW